MYISDQFNNIDFKIKLYQNYYTQCLIYYNEVYNNRKINVK